MSLINKMLQDLDARGGATGAAGQAPEVKAVPALERDRRPLIYGGAALAVLALAAGGWYAWQTYSASPAGPVPKLVDNSAPNKKRFQEPPAAANNAAPAQVAASTDAVTAAGEPASPRTEGATAAIAAAAVPAPASVAASGDATSTAVTGGPSASDELPHAAARAPAKPSRPARALVKAESEAEAGGEPAEHAPSPTAAVRKAARTQANAAPADGVVVRELTPKQMSENSYRRALTNLQEGRVSAALADLDKAVEVDPRNEAARQTYVSLLLENRRSDDAIRQLRLALGIEPRQPGLAMILARLQLEKGGPALDTLMKTLPYARNNADYQAFLAGVLQREQRHAEAAEQYRKALAIAPGNGVWWMGLGISLQADNHLPEAREAYRHARSGSGLTPELKAFVDRKLEQLSR